MRTNPPLIENLAATLRYRSVTSIRRFSSDAIIRAHGHQRLSSILGRKVHKLKGIFARRRVLITCLQVAGIVVVLGLVAPFINAERFSGPIRHALQNSLGRNVDFDAVHFTLFSGPGFSLDNVTIAEDPRYGQEPFAHVPTLHARLRLDKLLLGRMQFTSLRLVDPSLNFVKLSDGTWNIVEISQRLSAPRSAPLNLFPTFEVSNARIDFKFGARKTTFYISEADLTSYPQRSGKLSIRFSGSPARTDRAGTGFGHLRGTADWYVGTASGAPHLDASVTLDPSNLSEMTTLVQGHDVGVHGTISSRARVDGPLEALNVNGTVSLQDVHRWDLLPSSGEDWQVRYQGVVNLQAHRFSIETLPSQNGQPMPLALRVQVDNFLSQPSWSVLANLDKAPVANLLPIARRMGFALPQNVGLTGQLDGALTYSSREGMSGDVSIDNLTATAPNVPPLHASSLRAILSGDCVHVEPSSFQTEAGVLTASGEYSLSESRSVVSLDAEDYPADDLVSAAAAWFGDPPGMGLLKSGTVTGNLVYSNEESQPSSWTGDLQFANATLNPPGANLAIRRAEGRLSFDGRNLDLSHFSGDVGSQKIKGTYQYRADTKHPNHIHIEVSAADLNQIESALAPAMEPQGILDRLRVTPRTIPAWLKNRNLDGEITIAQFSVNNVMLGALTTRFGWEGTALSLMGLQIKLPEGELSAHGGVNLAAYSPQYSFTADVTGYRWGGGSINATGDFQTSGTGTESLQNLRAKGTFSGQDLNLSSDDAFAKISGSFDFSFAQGWPSLRLSNVEAYDEGEPWDGVAVSQSDGKLIFDLDRAGRQRHVVSSLVSEHSTAISSSSTPRVNPE